MSIEIYNTLTRRKEELVPREPGMIYMYVCGPTVYGYIHIGNARTFLTFDTIRRYLEYSGFDVTYVENITDVDDKIIDRAAEEGEEPEEFANKYHIAYKQDMQALGIRPPDIEPKATEHIPDMITMIVALIEKGYAYESGGDVYFEVARFDGYLKLSGRSLEEQQATECLLEVERKRAPYDFALWKAAKPGEPSWDSPWGPGRPGWHIECSTMSMKYLGESFDIHGGGQDLIFPHHENEIAQSEAYSGKQFVKYWMHSGMLRLAQEKMSKSLGNIKLAREVLAEHDADTVRLLMLGTHYRSPLSFSDDSLTDAGASLDRIRNCMFNLEDSINRIGEEQASLHRTARENELMHFLNGSENRFREAMDDDFNTAEALGVIFGVVKEVNTYVDEVSAFRTPASKLVLMESKRVLDDLCGVLGLFQKGIEAGAVSPEERPAEGDALAAGPSREQLIELLLDIRQAARDEKNFEMADRIRDGLSKLGVHVEDVRDGHRWRFER